jgi:hypothetical protein
MALKEEGLGALLGQYESEDESDGQPKAGNSPCPRLNTRT